MGTLRISGLALVSAFFVACGNSESGGGDDDDDSPTSTTNTTNPTTGSPTSNTTSPNTTNPTTSSGTGTTTGSPGGSGGMGGSGGTGNGGTTGGSAGDTGNVGGSAGAPGGTGGGSVVIEEDCGYEACGGDLADTDWSYARLCVEEDALLARVSMVCENVELVSANGEVSGTIGFGTDTYDQDASFSVTAEFQIPAECNLLGCALVQGALGSLGGFSNASCADSDGGCLCSGTLEGSSAAASAEYLTDGDNLTLDGEEGSYCATGDSFKYTGVIQDVEFVYETVPQ